MGEERKQLQIKDLPPDITEDQLRTVLSNKKRRGGGPVEQIDLDIKDHSALVTFLDNEAVNIIFRRGNCIDFDGHYAKLYRVDGAMARSSLRKKERLNKPKLSQIEANKTRDRSDSRPKNTNKQSLAESYNSTEDMCGIRSHSLRRVHEQTDEESSSELEGAATGRRSASCKFHYKEHLALKDNFVSESDSSQSESEEESNTCQYTDEISSDCHLSLTERIKRTVKFKITDVTKSKDFYLLYLEDMQYREGGLIESSIMMDAIRKHLFVTFKDPEDVKAMLHGKHDERYITAVTLASEKDFNWHANLVAVYGYSFESKEDTTKFQRVISKRLKLEVVDTLQYNESRSLIIKLNQDQCQQANLAELIWKCSFEFSGIGLIASPVKKSNTILITGLSSKTDDETIERYLGNKRSGGSSEILVPPIKRLTPQNAIATFVNLEAVQNILSKKRHELDGEKIKIDYFHQCLTPEFYEEHFGTTKSLRKPCQNASSQNKPNYPLDSEDEDFSENSTWKKKGKFQPKQTKMEFFNKDKKRKVTQNKKESYNEKLCATPEEDEKGQLSKEKRLVKKKDSSSEESDEAELKVKEQYLKVKEVKREK